MDKKGWLNLTFGEICVSLLTGGTPDTSIAKYWSGSVPWITGADFLNQKIAEPRRYISEEAVHRSNTHIIKAGNLLVVTRTGVGKVAIAPFDIAVSQDTTGVYFHENVSVDFMFYCIQSRIEELKKLNQGTSINGILKADLLALDLTIPESFSEQQKIAEILSTIDRAIEQTEAIIAKQQRIKTGLMQDLLTKGIDEDGNIRNEATHEFKDSKIGRIPAGWKVVPLLDFASNLPNSFVNGPFGSDLLASELKSQGVPVIYIRDISPGIYQRVSTVHVTRTKAKQLQACNVHYGDILISKVGDPPCDAAPYILHERAVITQDVIRIRPSSEVVSSFLCYLINSNVGRNAIKEIIIQGTRARVSLTEFKTLLLPKPKHYEQQAISKFLESIQKNILTEQYQLDKLRLIKTGLMQDLLTGNVRVTALLNDQETAQV